MLELMKSARCYEGCIHSEYCGIHAPLNNNLKTNDLTSDVKLLGNIYRDNRFKLHSF